LKKLGVFIPILLTLVLAFSIINNVNATSIMIYGDLSDGWVSDTGGINPSFVGLRVGDNYFLVIIPIPSADARVKIMAPKTGLNPAR